MHSVVRQLLHFIGCKRKQTSGSDSWVESLAVVLDRAEERAAEREERMRTLELEMEEKMREREERRDMQFMSMFSALLQQIGPRSPFVQPPFPYQSSQHPVPFDCPAPMAPPFTPLSSDGTYHPPSPPQN